MSHTVVVHEVRHCDAEKRALHSGIQPLDALAVDDAFGGCQRAGRSLLLLDLCARGECDQWVSVDLFSKCLS